jgi:hypothetical protein
MIFHSVSRPILSAAALIKLSIGDGSLRFTSLNLYLATSSSWHNTSSIPCLASHPCKFCMDVSLVEALPAQASATPFFGIYLCASQSQLRQPSCDSLHNCVLS